jgi:uncharacterized membrane protein YidH (DUF202 family)
MSYRIIRASEIGEYVYCRRAWWLRREMNYATRNLQELASGTAHHQEHETAVRRTEWLRQTALVILFLAVGLIVFWLVRLV